MRITLKTTIAGEYNGVPGDTLDVRDDLARSLVERKLATVKRGRVKPSVEVRDESQTSDYVESETKDEERTND